MANYESVEGVTTVIDEAAASGELSQSTADAIREIVDSISTSGGTVTAHTVAAGTTVDQAQAAAIVAPVVIMAQDSSIDATFDDNSAVKAIVVGGAGNSNVTFDTTDNVAVQLQGGQNDSVATGAGDDSITFAGGTATIETGEGDDRVTLQGGSDAGGNAHIYGGSGNMTVHIDVDLATTPVNATINAGDGFDSVTTNGTRAGHIFSFFDGMFRMIRQAIQARDGDAVAQADDTSGAIHMDGVNVVQFTDAQGEINDITILASTSGQAMIGRLYTVALGRDQAIDVQDGTNLNGLNYWIDRVDRAGADQTDVAHAFVNCDEFNEKYGDMTAQEFADAMFANLNRVNNAADITTVDGMTATQFAEQITNHTMTMQDVAVRIANSQEAAQVLGVDGNQYVIEGFVTGDGQ